jgi:lysyl-tRNA synthetase class 2
MRKLSEQEIVRREHLQAMIDLGINPYPAEPFINDVEGIDRICYNCTNIWEWFDGLNNVAPDVQLEYMEKTVKLSGRLMSKNIMGKASFFKLQDDSPRRMQVFITRDEVCPGEDKEMYNTVFKKLVDLGDFIGVEGKMFVTQTGELTLRAEKFTILSKSIKPLPTVKKDEEGNVHDSFENQEMKYRQRYVDLVVNPESKKVFRKRTQIIQAIRHVLDSRKFIEVETPILQPVHGGAAARPFETHHNKLDMPLFLRIANELYLKRLIVGGFERVYEFAKDFRNEGMSRHHNPEFTQVELYAANRDYLWMMDFCEKIMRRAAFAIADEGTTFGENQIDFSKPFERMTFQSSMIGALGGKRLYGMSTNEIREFCKSNRLPYDDSLGRGKLMDEIFSEFVEPTLIQPTIIYDYPIDMSPLAKENKRPFEIEGGVTIYGNGTAERFEVFVNGKEIANAYSEQNDPIVQRERFEEQLRLAGAGDDEAMALDEDFLRALEYGMPPTAGLGIGIDRLVMVLTEQDSIQDVLFFPQMRPENVNKSVAESVKS